MAWLTRPVAASTVGLSSTLRVRPMTKAEAATPMSSPICCARGVAPTRKPVLRSCVVAPPFAAAMATMPPTHSTIGW